MAVQRRAGEDVRGGMSTADVEAFRRWRRLRRWSSVMAEEAQTEQARERYAEKERRAKEVCASLWNSLEPSEQCALRDDT